MRLTPRLGLASVAAATVTVLAGCISAPAQEARPAPASAAAKAQTARDEPGANLRKSNVRSLDGSVIINVGDYHCAEGSHKYHELYGDCDPLPVVVLLKPAGGCIALIPYANLWIHTDKKKVKLTWQIMGPKNYVFDPNNADDPLKDGIAITKVTGTTDTTAPGDNYTGKMNGQTKYTWTLRDNALTPRAFYHYADVVDPSGHPCEPIDPGMINLVN